jgi:hypothetical protein
MFIYLFVYLLSSRKSRTVEKCYIKVLAQISRQSCLSVHSSVFDLISVQKKLNTFLSIGLCEIFPVVTMLQVRWLIADFPPRLLEFMWDLLWTKWHWVGVFLELRFPLPILIPPAAWHSLFGLPAAIYVSRLTASLNNQFIKGLKVLGQVQFLTLLIANKSSLYARPKLDFYMYAS